MDVGASVTKRVDTGTSESGIGPRDCVATGLDFPSGEIDCEDVSLIIHNFCKVPERKPSAGWMLTLGRRVLKSWVARNAAIFNRQHRLDQAGIACCRLCMAQVTFDLQ